MFQSPPSDRQQGSITILFALILTVILGFCAFAVDLGMVYVEDQKLQNALDASSLAAAQELPNTINAVNSANQYLQLNGFSPSDISVAFSNSNNTVTVSGTTSAEFTFARILGFTSTEVDRSASATKASMGAAFNYALFSGSETTALVLNGSSQYIGGSSHTNSAFIANGSDLTITGSCAAAGTVTVNGSQINIADRIPNAPFISMPDFSETLREQAEQAGQYFQLSKVYNGSNISVQSPIYINGDLTVNGSSFSGQGTIVVTGNITFNGSNLLASSDDAICFYSKNGNITVNGSGSVLEGIVYAPNGSITMNGSNQTVHGRVIGDRVRINGSNLRIISGTDDLKCLPSYGTKLVN